MVIYLVSEAGRSFSQTHIINSNFLQYVSQNALLLVFLSPSCEVVLIIIWRCVFFMKRELNIMYSNIFILSYPTQTIHCRPFHFCFELTIRDELSFNNLHKGLSWFCTPTIDCNYKTREVTSATILFINLFDSRGLLIKFLYCRNFLTWKNVFCLYVWKTT